MALRWKSPATFVLGLPVWVPYLMLTSCHLPCLLGLFLRSVIHPVSLASELTPQRQALYLLCVPSAWHRVVINEV